MFRHPEGGYQDFSLGPQPPREVRPLSIAEIERTREATRVVMQDVLAQLGAGAVEVIVGTYEELNAERSRRGLTELAAEVYGWVLNGDGSSIGLWHPEDLLWPDLVVSLAEIIQEGIIEGAEHWGVAFPMCPLHPNHPMEAEVVEDVASWVCPKGEGEPIPIGSLGAH